MHRSSLILLLVAALASCKEHNNEYCDGTQGMADPANCPPDSPTGCTMDNECGGRICDTAAHECVECLSTRPEACAGTTPVCSDDRTCEACTSHAQCTGSNACLPDGSCGDDANVAYVAGSGSGTTCTRLAPCPSVTTALATNRPYVKIEGTIDEAVTISGGRDVVLLASPQAKLTRTSGSGAILTVRDDGTTVSVFDLTIADAPNNLSGVGIVVPAASGAPSISLTRVKIDNNPGGGISSSGGTLTVSQSTLSNNAGGGISSSGGTLTVSQSTLSNNAGGGISSSGGTLTVSQSTLSNNAGGGISVMNGTFAIVGNVFFNNGSDSTLVGGISVGTAQNAANRLEFNSFHRNKAQDSLGCAIQCLAGTFTAKNNIMSGNATAANMQQTGGTCAHAYSIARPGSVPTGTGNSAADPLFADVNTGDLHIMATSPARSMADPNSNLTGLAARDIDGDARANPADIGADEVSP